MFCYSSYKELNTTIANYSTKKHNITKHFKVRWMDCNEAKMGDVMDVSLASLLKAF